MAYGFHGESEGGQSKVIHKGLSGPVRDQASRGDTPLVQGCKDQGQVLLLERGRLEVGGRGTRAHIEA